MDFRSWTSVLVEILLVWYWNCLSTHMVLGITTSSTALDTSEDTSDYNPLDPADCNYDFTGPSDDVFIIDRSESFNKQNFEFAKDFVKNLIGRSFLLTEGQNHIAVFTFTSGATKHIDFVSAGATIVPECELFLPGGLWENVAVNESDFTGEKLKDALDFAWRSFESSLRKNNASVSKRLWLMTDFHDIETEDLQMSRFEEIDIYGYSAGSHKEPEKFHSVIGMDDIHCNYRERTDWENAINDFASVKKELDPVPVTDRKLCSRKCPGGCECLNHYQSKSLDDVTCTEDVETSTIPVVPYEGMDMTVVIAASVTAVGIAIAIAIIISVCLCYRLKRRKSVPGPVPTLTRPQGTSTDTLSTIVTDSSTWTNSSRHVTENNSQTTSSGSGTSSNGGVATVSKSVQEDPYYINGQVGQVLVEHGIAQDTMTKNKPKVDLKVDQSSAGVSSGKLYKKNPGMPKTPDGYCGKHNFNMGSSRPLSEVSNVSSTPTYIMPISDDQSYKYAYPYANINTRPYEAPRVHGTMSPLSSHSYEKFTFPIGDNEEDNNNFSTEGLTPELAEKLSKFRKKCDKTETVKYTDFEDKQSSSNTLNGDVAGKTRYPDRMLPVNPLEKEKEELPVYIDSEQNHNKRSSAKLGTVKFKNLFYMFSKENDKSGKTPKEMPKNSPNDYSYCYTTESSSKEMSHPFREIM